MLEDTSVFDVSLIKRALINETLKESYDALNERGYNPTNQIVGYLISGDPGFISSYKDTRKKLTELDRSEIIATILTEHLNK